MISFALAEEQRMAQAAAAAFARDVARPAARASEEDGVFPEALLARAWSLGLVQAVAGGEAPEQPSVLNALALEAIAHGDAALAVALAAPLGFVKAIAEGGSRQQRETLLPLYAGDRPRFAAFAHADAGWFRGAGRATRARKTARGWTLDGAKALVPLAARCEHYLVTAETAEGASAFIVPASTKGVRMEPARGTLGLRALQMADVVFEAVDLPDEALLTSNPRRIVDLSRVGLSAILSGLSHAVYEHALPYTKTRVVHGEAIARKQAVAFKLAVMRIATQAMRWMVLRAACELDAAPTATRNARLAQLYAADHGLKIADEGVQLFGGYGFIRDLPLEMWARNARSLSVLDGLVGV
jgi:alkylation response protein AidB-like acyl-CoA dehydrogenase